MARSAKAEHGPDTALAERRGRISDDRLSRKYRLSAYDAAYLAVALLERLPLATLDRRLGEAASAEGIAVLGPK